MKNLYLLPTTRPSKLYKQANKLKLRFIADSPIDSDISINQHIYITSDEEIKEGDWKYCLNDDVIKIQKQGGSFVDKDEFKIILTTDQTRIKDGIQAIDDEFLEWFVKNPSCESVEIKQELGLCLNCEWNYDSCPNTEECLKDNYKIIIPQEESKSSCPKCRTTDFDNCHSIQCPMREEEAAEKYLQEWRLLNNIHLSNLIHAERCKNDFIAGAQWQAERMYSEEEVLDILDKLLTSMVKGEKTGLMEHWFEQFKKK